MHRVWPRPIFLDHLFRPFFFLFSLPVWFVSLAASSVLLAILTLSKVDSISLLGSRSGTRLPKPLNLHYLIAAKECHNDLDEAKEMFPFEPYLPHPLSLNRRDFNTLA